MLIANIYLLIITIIFGVSRGIKEGMVMHKPGVRDHPWYKFYHRISALVFLSAGLFFIVLSKYYTVFDKLMLIGVFILLWQLFESSYSITRFNKLFPRTENVFGLGFNIKGGGVTVFHVIRFIISLIFIYGGLK